jgi:hypothetical protein
VVIARPGIRAGKHERSALRSAKLPLMESKLTKEAERDLVEATQRLSPEERLNAFLTHTRLMMELYDAGRKARTEDSVPPP